MLKLLTLMGVLGGGLIFGLGPLERQAIYPFDDRRIAPSAAGVPEMHEVVLRTNGQRLIVWVAAPKAGKPTILFFHGNAGGLANRAGRFRHFLRNGYGVIAPAYRGSSGSSGRPNEDRLTRDATYIYGNLDDLIPGLAAEEVVIFGESLGTGVALRLVAETGRQPRAMILEAPYTALPDVVRYAYPDLASLIPRMTNIWNSRTHVTALKAPLLVVHGTEDPLIPIAQGREIYARAGSERKQFLAVRGAEHNDLWRSDVLLRIWRFVDGL